MPEYTLKIRRYDPETGLPPRWEDYDVELEDHLSVLDGVLAAKADTDGSIGIRCSCRAAICGSCGAGMQHAAQ
jgi:succinate dehydrogenase / fumarate reductase iron-sulfur subunit